MDSSRPSGYTEGVQKQEPWGPAVPHLKNIFGRAQSLYQAGGPSLYPGALVAPPSPETIQAQTMRADRARMGDPLTRGAKGYTAGVLSGEYTAPQFGSSPLGRSATDYATRAIGGGFVGQNPYLDAMVNRASQATIRNYQTAVDPGLRSRAILSGRTGPSATTTGLREQSQRALAETLGNIATDIYGGAYGQERGLQQQAAFAAPALAAPDIAQREAERGRMEAAAERAPRLGALDYADIEELGRVGAEREAQEERRIGEAAQRYQFAQEQPFEALQRYLATVTGGASRAGTTTALEPFYRNRAGGALAGGLAAGQLASLFPGANPYLLPIIAGGALLGSR